MSLGELQPPGEDRNQAESSLASKLACSPGAIAGGDFPRGRYIIRGPDQEQVREAVVSFSVLSCIARSCTFLVFMGLAEAKIK